jgi:hypothetical protein
MRLRRLVVILLGLSLAAGGCQCRAPQSAPEVVPDAPVSAPDSPPTCVFSLTVTAVGEWRVSAHGPQDRPSEGTTTTLKKRPGPAGGFERKVDPKYRWDLTVKEFRDEELVLRIEFDSLGSTTGLSVAGDGVQITRAKDGDRTLSLPVRLGPGRYELEIAARRP